MKLLRLSALVTSLISSVLFAAPGDLDPVFLTNIGAGLTPNSYPTFDGGTGAVNALTLQADGRIIAGGNISKYNNTGTLGALKRLNADGTPDATFNSAGAGLTASSGQPEVNALLTDPDGKIYVGGTFTHYNGTARGSFLRLNADGTLDAGFTFSAVGGTARYVHSIARQADGKVLIGGAFTSVNGTGRTNFARLNADGTTDTGFMPTGFTTNGAVRDIAIAADGRIYVAGVEFNASLGRNDPILRRFFADGTRDLSFAPVFGNNYGSVGTVLALADGRVVIGGSFAVGGSTTIRSIACFNANGTPDTDFNTNTGLGNGDVMDLVETFDGRILASGIFTQLGGQTRASIVRLAIDGTIDPTFAPPPYAAREAGYITHLYAIALQPDGRILSGGWFDHVSDPDRAIYNLARFEGDYTSGAGQLGFVGVSYIVNENSGTALISVARHGGVTGAVSVDYATSPVTADGADYTATAGTLSWADGEGGVKTFSVAITNDAAAESTEFAALILTSATGGATINRAAATLNIRDDDSLPTLIVQPSDSTVDQSDSITFSLAYDSVLSATIQWQLNTGSGFADIPGATNQTYIIGAADLALHSGTYRAVVTNANGSTYSNAATLTVKIPAGAVVPGFNPGSNGLSQIITAGLDPAGNILAGGANGLFRLSGAGVIDTGFTPAFNGAINSLVALPDGSALVAGAFTTVTGTARNYFAHINASGTLDTTVNFSLTQAVNVISLGGSTRLYLGHSGAQGIKRYTLSGANGTLDATFVTTGLISGSSASVQNIKERADGKVFVAYTNGSSSSVSYNFRLLTSTGSIDPSFTAPTLNWFVNDWEVLPDGRVIIVGRFSTVNGVAAKGIAVLRADGSLDTSFNSANAFTGFVTGIRFVNGRFLTWGAFTAFNGTAINGIVRLNLDGTLDPTFKVGTGTNSGAMVNTVVALPDSSLFLGGNFTSVRGLARQRIALLEAGPTTLSVALPAYSVIENAGSVSVVVKRYAPSVGAVSINYTTVNGTASAPDDFTATAGTLNWAAGDLTDRTVSIPLVNDASGEPVESFQFTLTPASLTGEATVALAAATIAVTDDDNPPIIITPPQSQNVGQGLAATFTVAATSTPAATYRWTFNGVDLNDGSGISGATTATLTITNAGPTHVGAYRVRLTNANGPTTSDVAQLTITLNPAIADHTWPTNVTVNARVSVIVPLPDGGAYVGGRFTNFNGQTGRSYLVKISANGTIDPTFSPAPDGGVLDAKLVGNVLYVLADFTGPFSQIGGGAAITGFAALDAATGARLAPFMTNLGVGATAFTSIRALAVFPDGDVLLGGDFTSFNNNFNHRYLARLNADGTLDAGWNTSQATPTSGTALVVTAADVGSDGKAVAGGTITHQGGRRLIRFNADGSRDATFVPDVAVNSTSPTRIRILADGRVMATGTDLPPSNRTLTRVSSTGVWSSAEFFGTTSGVFYDFAHQRNGRTIGVGQFNFVRLPSGTVSGIARLDTVGATEQAWPTGAGFDSSAYAVALAEDGHIWVGGDFTTYNGGAAQRLIRLNGDAIPLAITLQPKSTNVNPAATATFTARATGTSAITYQWRKDATPLADGGNISGATTAQLSIANAAESDEGVYTLRVTNASGEEISTGASLVVLGAPEILSQPDATTTTFGNRPFALEVAVRGIAPLTYQWRKGGIALVEGANGITGTNTHRLVFANLALADAGSYDVVITNGSGTATATAISLVVNPHPSDRAATFASVYGNNPTTIYAILPLADGGALVGGTFNSINGANSTLSGGRLARVLPNGEVAALPFILNGDVRSMALQPDGKIVIGGMFTTLTPTAQSAVTRNRVARLNADFTLDTSFDVGSGPANSTSPTIASLAIDSLGRIYAAGDFTSWSNRATNVSLVRLRPDGSVDTSFNTPLANSVFDVVIDASDRVYIAGPFTNYQGGSYLVRLLADGSRDSAYTPANVSGQVLDLHFQPDGKLLFIVANGVRRNNADGTADAIFPTTIQGGVTTVTTQANGQILVGGNFTTYTGFNRSSLVRLNSAGVVDPVLAPTGSAQTINVVRADAFGRIWVGGNFTVFNDTVTNVRSLFVFNGDATPLGFAQAPAAVSVESGQTATFTTIATGTSAISYRWLRNGVELNDGGNVSGSTTASLVITNALVLDEASYSVRISNASGTLTSSAAELVVLGTPEILTPPVAQTLEVGQTASFYVQARGAGTLTYQWFKNGTPLSNGGNVSGATGNLLTLSSLVLTDGSAYSVRVTGSAGNVTTTPAVLTVNLNPAGVNRSVTLPTFNNSLYALLPNDDGTFFAGGQFSTVSWTGGSASRTYFAKINANGSPDTAWPVFNGSVYAIAKDSTGRLYVGGTFTTVTPSGSSAVTRNRLVRLNANGTLDTTFNAPGGVAGAGPSSQVKGIKIDPTGRVYIFGEFSQYNGVAAPYISRLNEDGSRDTAFVSPATSFVYDVEFTSDNRLWIGHGGSWSGQLYMALTSDAGARDTSFAYSGNMMAGGLGLLADNTAISFSSTYPYIQKVGLTGAITSLTDFPNNQITKHAQGGSRFYVHGPSVTTFGSTTTGNLIRINSDGTRDATFAGGTGINGTVETMVTDSQGRLWVGGNFLSYNGDTTFTKLVILNGGEAQSNSGPPADPFANYLTAAGVPEGQRGPNDDPDSDGASNLLEYALGLNPALADPADQPMVSVVSGQLTYIYARARADVTYLVETTTDLGNPASWTATGVTQGTPDVDGVTVATVPMDVPTRFLRLKVTR